MDPSTVVVMLAAHLALSGVLFAAVSWSAGRDSGLLEWGAGSIAFGIGIGAAPWLAAAAPGALTAWPDAALLAGSGCLVHGFHRFLRGRACVAATAVVTCAALVVHACVAATLDAGARAALLEAMLAIAYFAMTALSVEARRASERVQLLAVGTVFAGLGTVSAGQAISIVRRGVPEDLLATASTQRAVAALAILLIGFALLWLVHGRMRQQIAQLRHHDTLTGLLNRDGLREALAGRAADRARAPLVLLQVDLDEFRALNDRWGQAFGDRMLAAVAATLRSCVRHTDLLARTGGEEFVVASFGAEAHARMLAERIRERVRQIDLRAEESPPIACSASIGISSALPAHADWQRAFAEADDALYRAKRRGRDACVAFSDVTT